MQNKVTVVSVNFKTPGLIRDCVTSLREFYPRVPLVMINNGGCAESSRVMRELKFESLVYTTLLQNKTNTGHGPSLTRGIEWAFTPYVFTLDSDTVISTSGFLERMIEVFENDKDLFALGWLRYTNANGVASPKQNLKRGMPYVHPYACMIDRAKYLKLKQPFIHSGAPATRLMQAAKKAGYVLGNFPIEKYIWHKEAGTRGCFAGEWNVDTGAQRAKWRKHRI